MILRRLYLTLSTVVALGFQAGAVTSDGILFINEDWYGHQNSTVNHLDPDDPDEVYWSYRVIQEANPGKELGCTNQYGAIWRGRLYLIAKQDKDPGASVTGGRITVVDAKTYRIIRQLTTIDPSGSQCDGRAFVGVDDHKGYVSTSNGIWILNLETLQIDGQVAGTSNPNAGGNNDRPNVDPTGALYKGQTGTMLLASGKVFAVHQQYGLLVIDPVTDRVTDVLDMEWVRNAITDLTGSSPAKLPGIGSTVVKSKDGMIWHSLSVDDQGLGSTLPYLVCIDPVTLTRELIPVEGTGDAKAFPPSNSWYAWTPDPFVASSLHNELYWCGGADRWFSKQTIYRYDINAGTFSVFNDLAEDPGNWSVYGCSLGIDPKTDEIYASLFHDYQDPTYVVRRFSTNGEVVQDYPMISNYWFPSHPVFLNSADYSGIGTVGTDSNGERIPAAYYDLYGRYLGNDPSGIHGLVIRRTGSDVRKIMLR